MYKTIKADEARKMIGKKVQWEHGHDPYRGCFIAYGTVDQVKGKNIMIDGDWKWLPNLINIKLADDIPQS